MSQKATILRMLEDRGELGVHSFEFYERRMPRGAAVIHTLKKEGHAIESEHETYRGESEGVRYFLRSDQLVGAGVSASSPQPNPYDTFGDFS